MAVGPFIYQNEVAHELLILFLKVALRGDATLNRGGRLNNNPLSSTSSPGELPYQNLVVVVGTLNSYSSRN